MKCVEVQEHMKECPHCQAAFVRLLDEVRAKVETVQKELEILQNLVVGATH